MCVSKCVLFLLKVVIILNIYYFLPKIKIQKQFLPDIFNKKSLSKLEIIII